LSDSLNNLFEQGYSSGFMHLVGFGTGANIFGTAGRNLRVQTSHTIGRITGLSPSSVQQNVRLTPLDAQFVDTIHTEGKLN
jgi:Lipase